MASVEIEYCVPCGHLDQAQETQKALLEEYGQSLDHVALKPGDGGVFKVRVDGDTVYDKEEEGYDLPTLKNRVEEYL